MIFDTYFLHMTLDFQDIYSYIHDLVSVSSLPLENHLPAPNSALLLLTGSSLYPNNVPLFPFYLPRPPLSKAVSLEIVEDCSNDSDVDLR